MTYSSKIYGGLISILLLFACSTGQKSADTTPTEPKSGLETIAILGTNDIHGTLSPMKFKTREVGNTPSIAYEAAGGAVLSSYVQTLKSEFEDRFIWLDAGDEFQGSLESNLVHGASMVQFFNQTQLTAAAIGNHEFDFGIPVLTSRMEEAKYPYLAANITDKKTEQLASFPNTLPHYMITVGKLRVGIIGLSTLETPTTTRAEFVKDLHFNDLKTATLRESDELRRKGAKIVLLTAHVGLKCNPDKNSANHIMRKETDPQGECGDQDEMVRLLRSLPAGTIDGVVSGHSHQVIHHWIAGVPVIQGGAFGRYINVIYLTYDWSQQKLVTDETRIEGPIPVCGQVFQNQNDCNGDRPAPKNGRGPLVQSRFHGKPITPDDRVERMLEPFVQKANAVKHKKVGTAARTIEHPPRPYLQESQLGNLIADSFRHSTGADFALVNPGGVRSHIEAGTITFDSVFRALPFDNVLALVRLTAQELRNILRVAQSGARGFTAVSGLRLRLIDPAYAAVREDLDKDGRNEGWETNRILDITLPNGDPLSEDKWYTLAMTDFLANGGDDFSWAMSKIPNERIQMKNGILARDALVNYIQEKGTVNTIQNPLIPADNPRLHFEKPPAPPKPAHHKRQRPHKKRHR
jgi:5'-nucleotidase